jgi:hypothetical protein
MVLEAAVNGGADLLVTFNERDYGTVPERFGVQVTLRRPWKGSGNDGKEHISPPAAALAAGGG